MPTRKQLVSFPELHLGLQSTSYLAGEKITRKLRRNMLLDDYPIRHLMTSGSFRMAFPEAIALDEINSAGMIFPAADKAAKLFTVEAIVDSEYYCILPDNKFSVTFTLAALEAGGTAKVPKGGIAFVFGAHEVDGKPRDALSVLACVNSGVTITASGGVQIVTFFAEAIP